MRSSLSVHAGPFVVARDKKRKVPEQVRVCSNKQCENHDAETAKNISGNFCPICGQAIIEKTVKVDESYTIFDVIVDLFDGDEQKAYDTLPSVGEYEKHTVLTSEDKRVEASVMDEDGGFETLWEEGGKKNVNMEEEVNLFKTVHAEHLKAMEDAGFKVKVVWGLLSEWS